MQPKSLTIPDQIGGAPGNVFLAACRPDCSEKHSPDRLGFDRIQPFQRSKGGISIEVTHAGIYRGSVWRVFEEQSGRKAATRKLSTGCPGLHLSKSYAQLPSKASCAAEHPEVVIQLSTALLKTDALCQFVTIFTGPVGKRL